MAGETVGSVLLQVLPDLKKFRSVLETEGVKAADAAGQKVGRTFGQRISSASKAIIGGVAGGLGSALLIGTTARLRDLESATADFRRETGATADEANRAGQAINDMAGRNLQPIAEIGRTLTAVTVQWGLTGDAAASAAEDVLKFARATGMDAETAVNGLDNVMDSWNLTADRSREIMDKLIVSHQRYGGDIEQNIDSLAGLAPAMQAANFEIEDGIGLLGLFGSKGLDANQGAAAFAKALTKVQSPEELQALIVDISNTTDKFDRARKAADLFGARAGAKLANALGGVNLDDYTVSMEDAAGATDRAADASLTMADKVQLAFRNITSDAVRLLGENGTLLQGIAGMTSLIGPLAGAGKKMGILLGTAIGAALGPKIVEALGAAIGAGMLTPAALATAGLTIGIPIALIVGKPAIDQAIHDLYKGFSEAVGASGSITLDLSDVVPLGQGQAATSKWYEELLDKSGWDKARFDAEVGKRMDAFGLTVRAAFSQIQQEMERPGNQFHELSPAEIAAVLGLPAPAPAAMAVGSWGERMWREAVPRLQAAQQAALDAAFVATSTKNTERSRVVAAETAGSWLDGMVGALRAGIPLVVDAFGNVVRLGNESAAAEAANLIPSIKSEIQSRLGQVHDVMVDLKYALAHPWSGIREAVSIEAALTSDAMRRGLKSKDPAIRAEAEDRKRWLLARLDEITTQSGLKAFLASKALRQGLKSKDPEVRAEWRERRRYAKRKLEQMREDAALGGDAQGSAYKLGLFNQLGLAATGMIPLLGDIAANLGGSLPETGPLVGTEKGGASLGEAWMANLAGSLARSRGALAAQLSGVSGLMASGMASLQPGIGGLAMSTSATSLTTVRHIHELAPGSAAQLRAAGFDDQAVAGYLLAPPGQGGRRWEA